MIISDENDEMRSPSFLDRDLLDELNGEPLWWYDEEMKLYMQVTIAINFSQSQT